METGLKMVANNIPCYFTEVFVNPDGTLSYGDTYFTGQFSESVNGVMLTYEFLEAIPLKECKYIRVVGQFEKLTRPVQFF